jgi:hypothetical protein
MSIPMKPLKIDAKEHLAEALKSLSQIPKNEGGHISWESSELERGTFELIYSLIFSPPLDDHIKDGAIWHVLNECARENDFSTKFFLKRLRAFLAAHFSREPKRLVAVSQVNAQVSAGLPAKIPSPLGVIEIKPSLLKTDKTVISTMDQYERDRLGLQDGFLYVSCRIATTDDRSAIDAAYRNIKYGLGVLNLITLGYGVSHRFGIPNAPIGKFLSASTIFTIDRRQRKLGNFLSETHYPVLWKQNFSVWQRKDAQHITKLAKYYVSDLARIDFQDKVIQAIILFQEGLESTHIDVALLKFWTGIEILCAREEREPAERTIERASSIFVNRDHAAMRLNFIQEFRNKIVHRGNTGEHALLCAQWGSIYLAKLIGFCLFNNFKFRKRSELMDYLSAPADQVRLAEMISLYRKRLNVLKKRVER